VSREEWNQARVALLAKEKELTHQREALAKERRALPWVKVEKNYTFETAEGEKSLSDLFGDKRQLIVYHFMMGPDWEAGCPSCSYLTDHYQGAVAHLAQRDVAFVGVSRAPLPAIQAYRKRMGWTHRWVSSLNSAFNFDFQASFEDGAREKGTAIYNFKTWTFPSSEAPGMSVFAKDKDGVVFHTYSRYARGLDDFITAYHYLDMTPAGRDEAGLPHSMAWVKRHDEY